MNSKTLALVATLFVFAQACASDVHAAAKDLARLPAETRQSVRYLYMPEIAVKERADFFKVMSGHCAGLSRETDIVVPQLAGPSLIRLNLDDYGWDHGTWEKLTDPYSHVEVVTRIERLWEGGVWPKDGQYYAAGTFKWFKETRTPAIAPWLADTPEDKTAIAYLIEHTQSKAPIVNAAWWFNQTAAALNRTPGYYDFLQVKNKKDFEKLIGYVKRPGRELLEAVVDSGVATQGERVIVREDTVGGGYLYTLDFFKIQGKQNPQRNFGKDILNSEPDAFETYGHLPCGMWVTGAFGKNGDKQDAVPGGIASDHFSKSNDKQIHVGVSCIRCHTQGGIQDFDGWVRGMPPGQFLQTADYYRAKELRRQYLRKFQPYLARDRAIYAEAVKEATGWTPEVYAAKYAWMWERYEDARVTADFAGTYLGMKGPELQKRLVSYQQATGGIDPPLSNLLKVKGFMNIRQWEEVQPVVRQIIASGGAKK